MISELTVKIGADIANLEKGLKQIDGQLKTFSNNMSKIGSSLVGAFSFSLIAKQVIDVTSNFQKFEAVLTNTLGSKSEAQKALKGIQDFAAKTPFSVQELTSSFVKLANQGFKPTADEMRKLGDLSASTGKSFDQLTEGIIDAQTGEFERLKEFGIRASKSGDQVKFTFKGVQTQVKFTSDEIRKYILSLGDLEGVSGSMAAISETLGGRISNLGDAWDNLMKTIGESSKGPINATVESLTQLTKVASNLGAELELRLASYGIKNLKDLSKEAGEFALNTARLNGSTLVSEIIAPFEKLSDGDLIANASKHMSNFVLLLQAEGASVQEAIFLWNAYIAKRLEVIKTNRDAEKSARMEAVLSAKAQAEQYYQYVSSLGLIEAIELQLKDLEEKKKKAFSVNDVVKFTDEIENLRGELDKLKSGVVDSGQRSRFGLDPLITPDHRVIKDSSALPGLDLKAPDTSAFERLSVDFPKWMAPVNASLAQTQQNFQIFSDAIGTNIAPLIEGALENLAVGFGETLGKMMIGTGKLADFGDILLSTLGGLLSQLGQIAIEAGIGLKAITIAFETMNPAVAIVAGVALVALGSAISGSVKKLGSGGSGGGGFSASSVSPGYKTDKAIEQSGLRIDLTGEFTASGKDLKATLNNQNIRDTRLKG